jgi:tRNA pseudouridine55 synthase
MTIDFEKGEVWIIDKPYEWTSTDVVRKIKFAIGRKLKIKKFKIGHAGTLDPLATGLLLICLGRKTKEIEKMQEDSKEYTGIITIGATTGSYDLETRIEKQFDISGITEEMIHETARSFVGEQLQRPPIFSAKKINGRRAYKMARNGEIKKVAPFLITIHKFAIEKIELPNIHFKVECSKGTYLRSLAHDFGLKLENGAHLRELRRTASGAFKVENGYNLQDLLTQLSIDGQPVELSKERNFRRTE